MIIELLRWIATEELLGLDFLVMKTFWSNLWKEILWSVLRLRKITIYLWYIFDVGGHLECIQGDRKEEEEPEGEWNCQSMTDFPWAQTWGTSIKNFVQRSVVTSGYCSSRQWSATVRTDCLAAAIRALLSLPVFIIPFLPPFYCGDYVPEGWSYQPNRKILAF